MNRIRLKDSDRARILIRAANWVGDAIMTTPVVRAVRRNFPRAEITVLAKPWVIPVYEHSPHVDQIMIYDAGGRHGRGLGGLRLSRDIRTRRFDLAILMQNAFEAALLAFLAGIPERAGYNTDGRTLLLNRAVRLDPALKKRHLVEYYIGILKGIGLRPDGTRMDLPVPEQNRKAALQTLIRHGFEKETPVIGINPGATGGTAKRWFPERYAELSRLLALAFRTRILIFGGPADHELGEAITALSRQSCINLAGKTSLAEAFALISTCDLFVTNDSGLMHAAAALNIPQVAIIGSTDPAATGPAGRRSLLVREPVSCSPCLQPECPTDHRCMSRITVDRIYRICLNILGKNTDPDTGGQHPV